MGTTGEAASVVRGPEPRPIWPSILTLLAALAGMLLGGCFTGVIFVGAETPPDRIASAPGFMITALAVSQFALLLAVWKVPRWAGDTGPRGLLERMAWQGGVRPLDLLPLWVGGMAVASLALALFALLRPVPDTTGFLTQLATSAKSTGGPGFAALLVFGAILPGLGEELTFRGLLQTRLVERWGAWRGIAASAALFGLWHFDLRQGTMAFALGVWYGAWAHQLNTVIPGALAHMLNNAMGLFLQRLGGEADAHASLAVKMGTWLGLMVLAALVLSRRSPVPAPMNESASIVSPVEPAPDEETGAGEP